MSTSFIYFTTTLVCAIAFAATLSEAGKIKAITTPSPECRRKCANCPKVTACPSGVSMVTDECGCCKTCARQLGQSCDESRMCDYHKELYCSYSDVDVKSGICVAKPGRACFSNSKTYANGETFDLGCKATCLCIDGNIGCQPKCPISISALPPKHCKHPRLVTKPGQCCPEWVCPGGRSKNGGATQGKFPTGRPIRHESNILPAKVDRPIQVEFREGCPVQTTEWSSCTTTCGWGVSERVTNDNKGCKLRKEKRLCQLRPCNVDPTSHIKKGKRCVRTMKPKRRVRFAFSGCHSRVYSPKYCGSCKDGRCCVPKRTVTKAVAFTCDNGYRFKKRMMMVKSCQCNQKCAESHNDIFHNYRQMGKDTWQS